MIADWENIHIKMSLGGKYSEQAISRNDCSDHIKRLMFHPVWMKHQVFFYIFGIGFIYIVFFLKFSALSCIW